MCFCVSLLKKLLIAVLIDLRVFVFVLGVDVDVDSVRVVWTGATGETGATRNSSTNFFNRFIYCALVILGTTIAIALLDVLNVIVSLCALAISIVTFTLLGLFANSFVQSSSTIEYVVDTPIIYVSLVESSTL